MKSTTTPATVSSFYIEAMDCPTEEGLIRNKFQNNKAVETLEFNLIQRVLTVTHSFDSDQAIVSAIEGLGMKAIPVGGEPEKNSKVSSDGARAVKLRNTWLLVISGIAAAGAEAAEWFHVLVPWLPAGFSLVAILCAGLGTYKKGFIALKNLNININALMSVAVTGAFILGQFPEAAMVIFLFAIAERIEAASLDRARKAIGNLLSLSPDVATVLGVDGQWQALPVGSVVIGQIIRIKPGERVPLDGVVTNGSTTIDQSPITGESIPVEKRQNDQVYAGTINQNGEIEIQVSAATTQTVLAKIIHTVEEAQGSKAPTQRFVDTFSKVYTPIVFGIAILVAILPPLLAGGAWFDWIYKALVLLVVACPCALVISTPVTVVSALAIAARHGILIKGGEYLEQGHKLTRLALDKTGTITYGKPVVTDSDFLHGSDAAFIAASLAARSDHPVSGAIARKYADIHHLSKKVRDFTALPGLGIRGSLDGVSYHLGNHTLIANLGLCNHDVEQRRSALENQGKTTVLLANETQVLAIFAVADTIRESSKAAVEQLHRLGIKTVLLSGDNPATAQAIGVQAGVSEVKGGLLPEDKQKEIITLRAGNNRVGMVGDGINDAPALAQADIGFAMGGAGTDTAIETADVTLMDDDLRKIPAFVRLSKATKTKLVQNISFALLIKAAFLTLTVLGFGTMWMAVFADMGGSLLVVFNGLSLLGKRKWLRIHRDRARSHG